MVIIEFTLHSILASELWQQFWIVALQQQVSPTPLPMNGYQAEVVAVLFSILTRVFFEIQTFSHLL